MKPAAIAIFAAIALGGAPAAAGVLLLVTGAIGTALLVLHYGPVLLLRLVAAHLAAAAESLDAARRAWRERLPVHIDWARKDEK